MKGSCLVVLAGFFASALALAAETNAVLGFDTDKNETVIAVKMPKGTKTGEFKKLPVVIPAETLEVKTHDCAALTEVTIGNHKYTADQLKSRLDFPAKKFSKMSFAFAEAAGESCEIGIFASASEDEFALLQQYITINGNNNTVNANYGTGNSIGGGYNYPAPVAPAYNPYPVLQPLPVYQPVYQPMYLVPVQPVQTYYLYTVPTVQTYTFTFGGGYFH